MTTWQFTPYIGLNLVAVGITLTLAYEGWQLRQVRSAYYFSCLMLATTLWLVGATLGLSNTGLAGKLAMLRVEYLGMTCAHVFWLLFVITYTSYDHWLTRRTLAFLLMVPVLTYLQILTVEQHQWFYQTYTLKIVQGLVISQKSYGPGFYLWLFYSYAVVLFGSIMLVASLLPMPAFFRSRICMPVVVVPLLILPNFLYITNHNLFAPYDPITLSLIGVGGLTLFCMGRDNFLQVLPAAHHLILQNMPSGVLILDNRTQILDLNPTAERILQQSRGEVVGRTPAAALLRQPALQAQLQATLLSATDTELEAAGHIYALQSTPFTNPWGRSLGRIILFHDVTQSKQSEATLRHYATELEAQNRELEAFAHTVAHDLKNPLTTLNIYPQLMEQTVDWSPEKIQRYAYQIAQIGKKMTTLIDALLLLSSVRQQTTVAIQPLDMASIVAEALARLQDEIQATGATVTISAQPWPAALGYAPWVEEVWLNYLSNALKYGGVPPRITLAAAPQSQTGNLRFWVQDKGTGLTPAQQAQVFAPFTRFQTQREGYGLGLSIVARIIERLGGTVGVESAVGGGSIFYFTLPAAITE